MNSQVACPCGYQWPSNDTLDVDAACPKCGTVVSRSSISKDGSTDDPEATRTIGQSRPDADISAPTILGYTILEELGRGGMGVVYRAIEENLKRPVALKVLLSGAHAGTRDLARFRAEAESAASVSHPNVVRVFAVGQTDGLPYIALEYVPGGTLASRIATGPIEAREAARIVMEIARGVQAAHDRDVVHRDLKPTNVMFGSQGEPKVADFGLAKIGDSGLTASGAIMGTPAYMAPEQARGDTKVAGRPADVWALGAILYECLSGHQPFRGNSSPETLRLVCESDPEPMGGIPSPLVHITLKCLEKDAKDRFQSAGEVADDLKRYLAGEMILTRPRGFLARSNRWFGRHQGPIYAGMGGLATIVIVIALIPPSQQATSEPAPTVLKPNPNDEVLELPRSKKGSTASLVEQTRWKMISSNNLRQLAIATHNLSQLGTGLPPPAIYDPKTGTPLLSWRVAYLPFLDEEATKLYKQFKLNEPWDSPHNSRLIEQMPKIYSMPGTTPPKGHTYYQVLTGPGTIFDPATLRAGGLFGKQAIGFQKITDGTVDTMLMVEAAKAVVWTKPEDVEIAPDRPLPALGGHHEGGFQAAMADGSVKFVSENVTEKILREAMSPSGGELLPPDWKDGPDRKSNPKK